MDLCTKMDGFATEFYERNARWVVRLHSGLVVFQDDGRPGLKHSAWKRLYDYCQETKDYIVEMSFGFRSNKKQLPSNAEGYFFCKGAMGCFGSDKTIDHFIVGTLNGGKLITTKWKVPEMLDQEVEKRDPNEAGICLIKKNTNLSSEPTV